MSATQARVSGPEHFVCDCCGEREAIVHGVDETGIHPVSLCEECKAALLGCAPPEQGEVEGS